MSRAMIRNATVKKIYGPYFIGDDNGEMIFAPTLADKLRIEEKLAERRKK